jgi:bifunctional non-homologous end joining protein LigD
MQLRSIILGTVDWLGAEVAPMILGIVLGPVSSRIVSRAPKGHLVLRKPGSKDRLDLRQGHVTDEKGFLSLKNSDRPQEVEYVIHEHLAERAGRHLDIRIKYGNKAVSWAVPMKGKRLGIDSMPTPGEKWLAVRQPDHQTAYMSFEGEIPSGLGKGTVKIWDKGIADVLKVENGNVHIRFYGPKAKGDYVIVDTKRNHQGLLVAKKSEIQEGWAKPPYVKKPEELLRELQKDPYRTAEVKVDGAALEMRIEETGNRLFSHRVSRRSGQLVEHSDRLPHLRDAKAPELAGTSLRVEAWHPDGVNFLSGTLNSSVENARTLQKDHGPIQIAVFDVVKYRGQDVSNLPYAQRREIYQGVSNALGRTRVLGPAQAAEAIPWPKFYKQSVHRKDMPTDGVVVKDTTKAYAERPWIKVKPHDTVDCTVTGVSEGLGKHTGRLGALTVQTPEGKQVQVGTGFSDRERGWLWAHRQYLPGETVRANFHIRSGGTTATGPRFEGLHPDKSSPEVLRMYSDLMETG